MKKKYITPTMNNHKLIVETQILKSSPVKESVPNTHIDIYAETEQEATDYHEGLSGEIGIYDGGESR